MLLVWAYFSHHSKFSIWRIQVHQSKSTPTPAKKLMTSYNYSAVFKHPRYSYLICQILRLFDFPCMTIASTSLTRRLPEPREQFQKVTKPPSLASTHDKHLDDVFWNTCASKFSGSRQIPHFTVLAFSSRANTASFLTQT